MATHDSPASKEKAMSNVDLKTDVESRSATFKVSHDAHESAVTASVPPNLSAEEFGRVATRAFDLIGRLTGCQCMSGRYRFVVQDPFLNDVIKVDLRTGQLN
jgi:hypothetical protein